MTTTNEPAFFVKGAEYRCKKAVKGCFTVGKTYKQTEDSTTWYGWLTNDKGERHSWSQPCYVAHECGVWATAPEAIDPRLYFDKTTEATVPDGYPSGASLPLLPQNPQQS